MRNIFALFLIFFLSSCGKPKTVFICGDHVCINNTEAKQYFEENLSLEVKIIDNKRPKELDLVELNLSETPDGNKKVTLVSKPETKKKVKVLSKKEIKEKKAEIKKKKKPVQKVKKKNTNTTKIVKKSNDDSIDICNIIQKCNIKEISEYLVKESLKKGFPDITLRESR